MAQSFMRDFDLRADDGISLACDDVSTNSFAAAFAPWPLRQYIVATDGRLCYAAQPVDGQFSVPKLRQALLDLL